LPWWSSIVWKLGRGTWTTTVTLILPTKNQLEGSGRGDVGFGGTVIQASKPFPQNTAIIEMGNTSPSMGVRIENLTIDCNHLPGATGIHNKKSQEQSGLHHILIENIAGISFDVEGSGAQNSGPHEDLGFAGGENADVTSASLCAKVELPHFFQPRIRGFQYQPTPMGDYAPVYVASEIKGNSFRIGGGTPGLRVSWAVTDIR
jgi:hypothetical protein